MVKQRLKGAALKAYILERLRENPNALDAEIAEGLEGVDKRRVGAIRRKAGHYHSLVHELATGGSPRLQSDFLKTLGETHESH